MIGSLCFPENDKYERKNSVAVLICSSHQKKNDEGAN